MAGKPPDWSLFSCPCQCVDWMCKTGRLRVSDWPGMDESLVTTPLANAHGFCLFAPSHFSHLTFFFPLDRPAGKLRGGGQGHGKTAGDLWHGIMGLGGLGACRPAGARAHVRTVAKYRFLFRYPHARATRTRTPYRLLGERRRGQLSDMSGGQWSCRGRRLSLDVRGLAGRMGRGALPSRWTAWYEYASLLGSVPVR